MRLIQTLYIDTLKDSFKDKFGWVAPEYHLMSWALSCLQLQKIYGSVELYANTKAAKLLIDILELPYSKVHLTHDKLNLINENLWALPKLYTYSLQETPFLHLDGDVFVFNKFSNSLLKSDLIAQNLEQATDYYISTQKELVEHFTYLPHSVKAAFDSPMPIQAVNAGILGGNNIGFIKFYANEAFNYINRNSKGLSKINVDRFNVFFEQHLFYALSIEKGIPVSFFFSDTINDNQYKYLGEFNEVPCLKNYLHLLGHYKKDEYTCLQMASKLRDLYPEYYYKIVSLCKKESIPQSISFYKNEKFNDLADYLQFNKLAIETYNNFATPSDSKNLFKNIFLVERENFDISKLLKTAIYYQENVEIVIEKQEIVDDFEKFTSNLKKYLSKCSCISSYYLYGRDIESIKWYCELFCNENEIRNKRISKCDEIEIIESEFDWAGLFNKSNRVGVKYYDELELSKGAFFNLVVLEVTRNNFSLFDIENFEKIILEILITPITINELLINMQAFADDDILDGHLDLFDNYIITLIKQLVIKKAIKPFNKLT